MQSQHGGGGDAGGAGGNTTTVSEQQEQSEPASWRPLFGGALSADLPDRYVDVSDFRPVPDNQEVWTDAERDESVIVEILERVEDGPRDDDDDDDGDGNGPAAVWFFKDLAEVNDASVASGLSEIVSSRALHPSDLPSFSGTFAAASVCVGRQRVTKSRDRGDARNLVEVLVANVRLPQVGPVRTFTPTHTHTTICYISARLQPSCFTPFITANDSCTV